MKTSTKYHIILCILWLTFIPLQAMASLSVDPAFLHVDLSKGNPSGTFTVTNLSNSDKTYRARALHFRMTPGGGVSPVEVDDFSLANEIKFNPKEFTLPGKSKRKIRFTVITRNLSEPREYWGAIEFTPLENFSMKARDKLGHSMNVMVISRILVPIYGMGKNVKFDGTIDSLAGTHVTNGVNLSGVITNTGDGILRLYGDWSVFHKGSKELLYSIPVKKFVVLPESKRNIKASLNKKLDLGSYDIVLDLKEQRSGEPVNSRGTFSVE